MLRTGGTSVSLTKKQIAELAKLMEGQRKVLVDEVRSEIAESKDADHGDIVDHLPSDEGDESIGDALAELNLVIIDRHVRELRDIDRAFERIRDGTYGCCIDCGDDIAFARLASYPTAKRCIVCQQKQERVFAHQGTPTL
jgi:RNA polymerase-binding protein DksA